MAADADADTDTDKAVSERRMDALARRDRALVRVLIVYALASSGRRRSRVGGIE